MSLRSSGLRTDKKARLERRARISSSQTIRAKKSLRRAAQFQCRLGLLRLRLGVGTRGIGRTGRMQRTRTRLGARHDHGVAVLVEVAIGEAHARYRATEAHVIALVEIEAGLERESLQRGAYRIAANLDGVDRQPGVADRTRAAELDGARHRAVAEDAAGAARAVEAGEGEHLVGDELACLLRTHFFGDHGESDTGCNEGPSNKTRQHDATPTHRVCLRPRQECSKGRLNPLLTIPTVATLAQDGW